MQPACKGRDDELEDESKATRVEGKKEKSKSYNLGFQKDSRHRKNYEMTFECETMR